MRQRDPEKMVARPVTVVQMVPELDAGGVERGTLELGRYLVRQGYRSIVISGGGRLVPQLESEGSEHVLWDVGKKSPVTLRYIPRLKKFLRREKIDILHLRSRVPAWVGYLAWRGSPLNQRPRLVTTFHGFYSINRYSAVMTKGERVIAISQVIKDHVREVYRIPEERIVLIHRGVDIDLFDPGRVSAGRIKSLEDAWNITSRDKPLIMLPGRVTSWKGHDVFMKSLAVIRDLDWSAVCVGELDRNSTYVRQILSLMEELHLEKRVRFVEHCSDMPAAYLLADIVVSASAAQAEAFGRVAVEAQAMERPVVATAHGGSLETVVEGKTGWLVTPGDADDMAKALAIPLTQQKLARQYGVNGRKWVRDNFTVEKMCAQTVALYENLLTTASPT